MSILCAAASSQHDSTFSLTVDSVADRPDLLHKMSSWFELTCGLVINGQSPVTSAASANLSYNANGVSYRVGVLVEICKATQSDLASSFSLKYWYASVSGYAAPTAASSDTVATYKMIVPTVVLNFRWAQSVIANSAYQEGYINSAIQQWQQADQQMFQITLGPSAAEGWINALDGVENAYNPQDPTTIYKVSVNYDYWYYCGGNLLGTNTANSDSSCTALKIGTP